MSATPTPGRDLPILAFPDAEAWRVWLDANHSASEGIWIRIAKRQATTGSVTYAEAVEVAICFGWIDGRKAALDEQAWLQKFTPRRARSRWSKINRGRAEDLIARGLMSPAGMAEVERAKADGRWDAAYDSPLTAAVPDDLAAALAADAGAAEAFARLDGRNRYAILYRIQDARRPETRARRIAAFVEMLADGRTPH
jgi:uncharacterized protein YdeI (YjbR/CyaY-like superfamily)